MFTIKGLKKPSRKITALGIVCFAVIASLLIIKYRSDKAHASNATLGYQVTDIATYNSQNDPTQDTQDAVTNLINETNQATGADPESGNDASSTNPSDVLARSLFSGYMSLSESNDTSDDSKVNLADQVAAQAAQSFNYQSYSADNYRILGVSSKDQIHTFADQVATIQIQIAAGIAAANAGQNTKNLVDTAAVYRKAADDLYAIPAPADIANYVLSMVNNYSIVSSVYTALGKHDTDPVTAEISIKYLQDADTSQATAVAAVANYFNDNGILFPKGDIGNYWDAFVTDPVPTSSSISS